MLGNLLIVLTILSDHHLHSPMYFLLANLSFIDTGVSSIATPRWFLTFSRRHKVISPWEAASLRCSLFTLWCEMVLLIVMAYDRYVAICPSHYWPSWALECALLFWLLLGPLDSSTLAQLAFVVNLPFCGPNEMDSFYCLIFLGSSNLRVQTRIDQFLSHTASSGFISIGTPSVSWWCLTSSSWSQFTKHSSGGSSKALSTLSSHHCGSFFFFGPCIIVYVWPFPTLPIDKFLAIFDVLITPFMNPCIYTFRNKEMKMAVGDCLVRF